MIICNDSQIDMIREALASQQALDDTRKTALVHELTGDPAGRGYAAPVTAADWARVIELLHGSYSVTVAAHTIPRVSIPPDEFSVIAARAAGRAPVGSPQQQGAWAAVRDGIMLATNFKSISCTDPSVIQGAGVLLATGLITQGEHDELFLIPVPETPSMASPRATVVLGSGVLVEVGDLVTLRVEGLI